MVILTKYLPLKLSLIDVMIQTVRRRLQVIIKQRKTKIASRQIFFDTLGSSILTDAVVQLCSL